MDHEQSNDTGAHEAPTAGAPAPAATPRPPAATVRTFRRRRLDKVISGVCSGLGAYTGTDPVLWRLGFVGATIFTGGVAAIVYVIAAVVVPYGDDDASSPAVTLDLNRWIGIALSVVGLSLMFGLFDQGPWWGPRGGVLWGLLLIGAGVTLWNGSRDEPAPSEPLPDARSAPPAPEPAVPVGGGLLTAPTTTPVAAPVDRPAAPRERSYLGRATLGATAIVMGVLLMLDSAGVLRLSLGAAAAVALLITGAGLIVGAWRGRARGLIALGVLLTLVLCASTYAPAGLRAGVGELVETPLSAAEASRGYRLSAGALHLDLTEIDTAASIPVEVGAGEVTIVLPADAAVVLRARIGAGELWLPGAGRAGSLVEDGPARHRGSGLNHDRTVRLDGLPGAPRLHVDVRIGVGELRVVRGERGSEPPAEFGSQEEVAL
ncbi:MAG TPA: PspC domain-containing protein [Actinomycetota bacterium]|nr:PspC domain-containing protein [Actinomycetota bacterium]